MTLQDVVNIAQIIAAIVVASAALWGIGSWKKKLRQERAYSLFNRTMLSLYSAKNIFFDLTYRENIFDPSLEGNKKQSNAVLQASNIMTNKASIYLEKYSDIETMCQEIQFVFNKKINFKGIEKFRVAGGDALKLKIFFLQEDIKQFADVKTPFKKELDPDTVRNDIAKSHQLVVNEIADFFTQEIHVNDSVFHKMKQLFK